MTESKGRPTPKRNENQRRRTGPVFPPPTNRKEAAKRLREQQAAARARPGDGAPSARPMLARDAGPIRAQVRDIVDGRRNLGVLLLPAALLLLVGRSIGSTAEYVTFIFWIATLAAVAIDLVGTGLRISRDVRAEFPGTKRVGSHIRYGLLRTTVIRKLRQPKPRGKRNEL